MESVDGQAYNWLGTPMDLGDHVTEVSEVGFRELPEVVLLVHAALLDRHMWRPFALDLRNLTIDSDRFRIVAYDVRGHGAARNASPITGIDQLADDMGRVLNRLGVREAHLCGISFGGAIAQAFSLRHPERVTSLTIAATSLRFQHDVMEARATTLPHGVKGAIEPTLARWFSAESLTGHDPAVEYARERIASTSPEHWTDTWRSLGSFDVTQRAHRLTRPVLALSGAQDPNTPPDVLSAAAAAYPNARHVRLDPGSHMLCMEQPAALAGHVAEFLLSTKSAG